MDRFALLVILHAKPGKESAVEEFLISARPLVLEEMGTTSWYAIKLDSARYGIFDTFPDESARNAHLSGEVAKLLFAKASELFAEAPSVEQPQILALKAPGA